MNVPTITADPRQAQAKLVAYREQLRRRADEEYEAAAAGYQALAQGYQLVNLADAFAIAGVHPDGRPKLAIARADRRQVFVRVGRNALQFNTLKNPRQSNYVGSLMVEVPYQHPDWVKVKNGYALVPMVPADVRPDGNLRDHFILWEVEHWSDSPLIAAPDYDPLLLRHIIGGLYAVLAAWELTELERAIMTGRRAS